MEKILTIAIPVYERYNYFEAAIQSVLSQTIDCQIIVVDQTTTHTRFRDYIKGLNDPAIKYFRNDEPGMFENMNKCIEYAETPWISILHDDDQLHCQFVENAKLIINQYGNQIGAFAVKNQLGVESIDLSVKTELTGNIKLLSSNYFLFNNLSPFPGVVFKKESGIKVRCFPPKYYPISDLYFWYELSKNEKILYLDQVLSFYRISSDQASSMQTKKVLEMTFEFRDKILKECNIKNPLTHLAVEKANLDLTNYFLRTYSDFSYSSPRLNKIKNILKLRGMGRLLNYHKNKISWVNIKMLKS